MKCVFRVVVTSAAQSLGSSPDSCMSLCFACCVLHYWKLSPVLFTTDKWWSLFCAKILAAVSNYAVVAGLSDFTLVPLQRVIHTAPQFLEDLRPWDHVTVALQTLHWLPVRWRINVHGVAFDYAFTYLLDAVVPLSMLPERARLWSTDNRLYNVPRDRCHCRSVPELSLLLVHKRRISYLHLSV